MAGDIVSIDKPVADAESKNFFTQRDEMIEMMKKMRGSIANLKVAIVGEAGDSIQNIYPGLDKSFDKSRALMDEMGAAIKKIRQNFIDTDSSSKVSM